ncbi:hypothetical protein MRX96_020280 [Rhipicephalus microplus]
MFVPSSSDVYYKVYARGPSCFTPRILLQQELYDKGCQKRGTVRLLQIFEEGYAHATVASSEPACQEPLFT